MAKTKAKKKATKKSSDPLTVDLRLLSTADRECMRAIRSLNRAILEPVAEPKVVVISFKYQKKKYRARVTAQQADQIIEAVKEGGNVERVVASLLSALTKQVATDLDAFAKLLGITAKPSKKSAPGMMAEEKTVPLGCCTYGSTQTPNLTQTQCAQYTGSDWNKNDPDCINTPLHR